MAKTILIILSISGLLMTICPPFLVFLQHINPETSKLLMLIGTITWFCTAPFWLNNKTKQESKG